MNRRATRVFGEAVAFLDRSRRIGWTDVALAAGLGGAVYGLVRLAGEWTGAPRPAVEIDLSLGALPGYTLLSLSRGLAAYVLSLLFTLAYGYWAARDRIAERVLVPALDILQSIPVLGFMPGLVLGLVAAFPGSNVGLELAAVVMIFTGQAWNMTFSFYHSLKSIPRDLTEVATLSRFHWWQRFRWVELPFGAIGLVWNGMMSMAGGWFFLMISESFVLGDKDFRLPGLGSYMSVAVAHGDGGAMFAAVVAMASMIVAVDQLLWRPVVVWAQKFRVEESGQTEAMESWFLDFLRRSRLLPWASGLLRRAVRTVSSTPRPPPRSAPRAGRRSLAGAVSLALFVALLALLGWSAVGLVHLLRRVPFGAWAGIGAAATLTLGRVLLATALGTLWTVPAGLAIGLSPRLSRILQPVVQVVASFPAPMLFPAVVAVLAAAGVGLGWGSILLMLLGTQWYILFNVIAGATAIPADLREAARVYRVGTLQRFRDLYLPAVFPYLVTGWVTAAGGAWNASIVSEYMSFRGRVLATDGLGARISHAAASGDLAVLAAAITVMAALVAIFNRLVWRRLHGVAEERFSLSR
ncbi:ABC transporter permease [Anaeromyxobacter dehalogenans]|uniref:ABC transporter, inner membrane subunit n=1 Tax=Anaeromyxobacter dehalogenans (strain 2CP-C) TaxID=290397 RepID=Q2IG76_ANADE|nr:ABC transporter permease subunit [Anaeromyxobacter dehalogenans]ABC83585.1 ABC transporter, inner membrane subunit [Anaeromyxobacter dehalogenans 2CP-C]